MEMLYCYWVFSHPSEGIFHLPVDGFSIPWTYEHLYGPFLVPWFTETLLLSVFSEVCWFMECGLWVWPSVIGANMYTVALVWGCLEMRALEGWLYLQEWQTNRSWLEFTIFCLWFSTRHSQLLRERTQLKNNTRILKNEYRILMVEQTELPASYEKAKRLCEEARMNICVPRAKQQQVGLGLRVRVPSCLTMNIDKPM